MFLLKWKEETACKTDVWWVYYFARDMKNWTGYQNALYTFENNSHLSGLEIYKKQFSALIYFAVIWNEEIMSKNTKLRKKILMQNRNSQQTKKEGERGVRESEFMFPCLLYIKKKTTTQ